MIDFSAWGTAITEVAKWMNSSHARRKEAALRAADAYIDIDVSGMYQGVNLSEKKEQELKIHFAKQFHNWKAG
jgi:hypothetical protein